MPSATSPAELAEQNLDAGDTGFEAGRTLPLPADPTADFIEGGTPVDINGDGYIEPMEGIDYDAGDEILGIVLGVADESDTIRLTDERGEDNYYSVHVDRLPVAVEVADASPGDRVQADGDGGYEVDATGDHPVVKTADEANDLYLILK